MADRYTIAAELKAYISAHARTQKEAADKCKISPPHFANLLNGKEAIGYSASRRIAGAFPEIDPDYLLTGEGVLCPPPGAVRITQAQRLKGGRLGDAGRVNTYLARQMLRFEQILRDLVDEGTAATMTARQVRDVIAERVMEAGPGISLGEYFDKVTKEKHGSTRTDIQSKWINKIVENYPDYSVEWLITGEGEMMKTAHEVRPDRTFSLRTDRSVDDQDIPLYELTATAGLVAIFNDLAVEPVEHLRVPNLPPVDGAVYVRGDSMSPLLKSGDIIIFKKTDLSPDGILWGQIYLLSYTIGGDAYTVVKYVKRSPLGNGHIRLVSANEFYDPVDIPAGSVTALALVKASITFYTME